MQVEAKDLAGIGLDLAGQQVKPQLSIVEQGSPIQIRLGLVIIPHGGDGTCSFAPVTIKLSIDKSGMLAFDSLEVTNSGKAVKGDSGMLSKLHDGIRNNLVRMLVRDKVSKLAGSGDSQKVFFERLSAAEPYLRVKVLQ